MSALQGQRIIARNMRSKMPPMPIAIAVTSRFGRGVISVGIRNLRAMEMHEAVFRDRTMKVSWLVGSG
jgi:hypothetical protein